MTLKEAVEFATTTLSPISDSASLDAQLLVCHACNTKQTTIITHPEQLLNEKQQEVFNIALKRRAKGEPLSYITGTKEFWSLDFIVNEHVLIPRPETELLVELTLEIISNLKAPRILDLGTGSGAIAISIAKERNDCLITATDVSQHALEVANSNAINHKVKINFIKSNWYEYIDKDRFDVIVSNPPYIANDDPNLELHVLKYEPNVSLISADNGIKDLDKIISGASEYLSNTGQLLLEHGFQQKTEVKELFKKHSFQNISCYKDLSGNNRVTSGLIKL